MDDRRSSALLTQRQREVLDRLDRRIPIKLIAAELRISQTRVNQHIAALKRHFGANDLSELVAIYRGEAHPLPRPLRKAACTNSHLAPRDGDRQNGSRAAAGELALADVDAFAIEAPWVRASEPVVVPRVLDEDHAVFRRLVAMLVLAVAIVAAVILTISAAVTIGALLDGVASVPVEESQAGG